MQPTWRYIPPPNLRPAERFLSPEMSPVLSAVLHSWAIPQAATLVLVFTAIIYLRGWWLLRCSGLPLQAPWKAASFIGGLLALWIALASPMDVFNGFVLTAHMLQHMTLRMLAPPLILLGEPLIPIVRGLPRFAAREFARPFLNWTLAQRVGRTLISPPFALVLMGLVNFAWHTPRLYQLALDSDSWHQVEHACFFLTSLLFWWPVVQPWPSKPQWPRWAMVPYLLVADLQNTTLSAILVFSDRVLYPRYLDAARLFDFSAQQDQAAAGAIMWVVGSLAFVVPAVIIALQCLSRRTTMAAVNSRATDDSVAARMLSSVESGLPFRFFAARLQSRTAQAMTFTFLFGATGLCFAYLLAAPSDDDQVLRSRGQSDHFDAAVYGPGGDIHIGSTAFSMLVQDRTTKEMLLDSEIEFELQKTGTGEASPVKVRANHEDSENKLLQSGKIELSAAGDWTLNVFVQHDAARSEFSWPLQVVKAQSGDAVRWSYMGFAATSVILLMIYFWRHRVPPKYHPEYLKTSYEQLYLEQCDSSPKMKYAEPKNSSSTRP